MSWLPVNFTASLDPKLSNTCNYIVTSESPHCPSWTTGGHGFHVRASSHGTWLAALSPTAAHKPSPLFYFTSCYSMSGDMGCMKATKQEHNPRSWSSSPPGRMSRISCAGHHSLDCNFPWCWRQWPHLLLFHHLSHSNAFFEQRAWVYSFLIQSVPFSSYGILQTKYIKTW